LKNATKIDEKSFTVSFDSSDEAMLRFEVPNFPELDENMKSTFSKPIFIQNLPWMIEVYQRKSGEIRSLGVFLHCDFKSTGILWHEKDRSCQAKAELTLINHKDPNGNVKRELRHLYNVDQNNQGWLNFMLWTDVIDPEKGFLKNNTATFEVKLEAYPLTNPNPKRPTFCGLPQMPKLFGNCGIPTRLETSDATFFLVRKKQCDTLRFWVYFIGSTLEAKNFCYTLAIADDYEVDKYDFQGRVFTLDKDEPLKGSVFIMETEAANKIIDRDLVELDVKITIRNLKEEAKDTDEESGVNGSD
jgi:hypothetical protein